MKKIDCMNIWDAMDVIVGNEYGKQFKSWMRLFAFHTTQILLGKVWIYVFSLQLWVNSSTGWALFNYDMATNLGKRKKLWIKILQINFVSYPIRTERLVNTYIWVCWGGSSICC